MSEQQRKSHYLVIEDDRIVLKTGKFSEAADLRNSRSHAYIATVIVGPKHEDEKKNRRPQAQIGRNVPARSRVRGGSSLAARRPA